MFLAATAWAQDSSATIEATGTERVRVQPKAVRLVFQIQANGKTAEEAVQQLQAQRETAVKKLKELGAEEDSIHSTPAALDSGIPGPPVFYPNPTPSYGIPGSTSSSPGASGFAPSTIIPPSSPPVGAPTPASPVTPLRAVPMPPVPDRDEPAQPTPSRHSPAPQSGSTTTGSAAATGAYAPGLATLPATGNLAPPARAYGAASSGYGTTSVAQAVPVAGPPTRTSPTMAAPAPAGSTSSSSGEEEATLLPDLPQLPPGVVPQPFPPGMPIPGASGGSEGQPGSGPVPPPMIYAPMVNFAARMTLTAEWPINASKPDNIALNVEKLREKLIAAKFVGDETTYVAPAMQRANNSPMPMMPMPANQGYATAVAVCVPNDGLQLLYTGTLSKSERKEALAAAMAKAKEQAAELAEAAGCRLGSLAKVSGGLGDGAYVSGASSTPTPDFGLSLQENEMCSPSPELPEFAVSVTLQFHIAP
jgi:uncharacterized protein YggE